LTDKRKEFDQLVEATRTRAQRVLDERVREHFRASFDNWTDDKDGYADEELDLPMERLRALNTALVELEEWIEDYPEEE
jgi:hypothetical protein